MPKSSKNSQNKTSQKKFEDAIDLLNQAAKDKKGEIENLLGDKYDSIREAIEEAVSKNKTHFNRVKKLVESSIDQGQSQLKQKKGQIDKEVRDNPWKYLGGTAAGALLLGFIMGSSRDK